MTSKTVHNGRPNARPPLDERLEQVLECLQAVGVHGLLVLLLDLEVNLLTVYGNLLGSSDTDLDLIASNLEDGDLRIIIYHQALAFFSR